MILGTVSSAPSRESAENSPARSPGRVPLAMFVSPDGRNLHPKCPHASNPYHKCTERCVERMNEGKKPREGETSSGISSLIMQLFSCFSSFWNGLNQCNSCAVLSTPSRESRENSQMSSPRFSPDTDDNIAVNSPARSPLSPRAARSVHPKCPNAQNPYHKCTERCMQRLNGEKKGSKGDAPGSSSYMIKFFVFSFSLLNFFWLNLGFLLLEQLMIEKRKTHLAIWKGMCIQSVRMHPTHTTPPALKLACIE